MSIKTLLAEALYGVTKCCGLSSYMPNAVNVGGMIVRDTNKVSKKWMKGEVMTGRGCSACSVRRCNLRSRSGRCTSSGSVSLRGAGSHQDPVLQRSLLLQIHATERTWVMQESDRSVGNGSQGKLHVVIIPTCNRKPVDGTFRPTRSLMSHYS